MKLTRTLSAIGLLAMLAAPSYAQTNFTENLSVNLNGSFSVTRPAGATPAFNAISLTGADQSNVALNFSTAAPLYNVVCTNGLGWNAQLSLPNGRLSTTAGANLPITYRGGTGVITPVGASTAINAGADITSPTGSLSAGTLKTVSAPTTALGSWGYRLGGFQATSIPANQAPGAYTGTLTVTFGNTP
ncbi:hypothetical protein JST97_07745 [bacterium]|nr:hypothetical protein [bacterium]